MRHAALTDPRTGLANRLHFELVYTYLFEGADRGVPLTVLMLSTKRESDEALVEIGKRLERTTRRSDLVAHVGGGVFHLLLLGTNMAGARVAADRLEEALEGSYSGALSMALATWNPDMKQSHELLVAADEALYRAESSGGGLEMV